MDGAIRRVVPGVAWASCGPGVPGPECPGGPGLVRAGSVSDGRGLSGSGRWLAGGHTAGPAAPGRLVRRTRPRSPARRPVPGSAAAAVTGTMRR
jgi:hypothetical protein